MRRTPALHRRVLAVLLPAALSLGIVPASASPNGGSDAGQRAKAVGLAPHVPGVVLVGFRPGVSRTDRAAARAAVGALAASPLSPLAGDAEKWTLGSRTTVAAAIEALRRNPTIRYAEPDYLLRAGATSNDPYYLSSSSPLWGMHGDAITPNANSYGTGADEAWAVGETGSADVYVGVIDEGIQYTHPDLAANIWTNPFDPVDGVDNDGNGYVDDAHGWDFFNNDAGIYDAGADSHGTHVSGTIGGVGGNALGVAGVNWDVTIISGKFLGPSGGSTSGAILAVDYLTDLKTRHGIDLVATSNSWGGGGFSQALLDAINRGGNADVLFVAAAGNSSSNNDVVASYPSNYQCTNGGTRGWDCMVAVAAIDSSGNRASFTSYGATTVDLGAPGVGVWSSVPTDSYASYSGTSMATPHVSGAVALCASINPALGARDLRNAILSSGAATASLVGYTATGDRLDVGALVGACRPATQPPSGVPSGLAATPASTSKITLAWTDGVTGESSYEIQRADGAVGSCGTWATVATAPADATSYAASGLQSATSYCFRVRAANTFNGGTSTAWSNETSAATASPPPPYVCEPAAYAWFDATGGSALTMTDDSALVLSLPFAVATYGQTYTSIAVSSNGFARLGSSTAGVSSYTNVGIPNIADPNAILAPFWDDLNPGVGGQVYAATFGSAPSRSFVVSWVGVPSYWVAGSSASFQVVLEEGSDVVRFQYQDVTFGNTSYDAGASATVGIEGETGEWGTQLLYNAATLVAPSAYRCTATSGTPPTITAATLPDGTTGVAYPSTSLAAAGGTTPYAWSVASGALPAGLGLSGSGVITGTPTATGTASFTARVTGGDGSSSTRSFSIRVAAPLSVSTGSLANASLGTAYSQVVASSGGQAPITWTLKAGSALPDGLSLSSGGTVSGTPTTAGSTTFTVVATDAGLPSARTAEKALTITVVPPPTIAAADLPDGTTTVVYTTTTLSASGGASPYTWSIASGALPAGLSLSSGGTISGTPTATGTASFEAKVTGANGGTSTRSFSIRVAAPLSVTTTSLPTPTLGAAYSQTVSSTGGTGPFQWSVSAGALPSGLSLSAATGVISGTPDTAGTFTFTVRVQDSGSTPRVATRSYTITMALAKRTPATGTALAAGVLTPTLTWFAMDGATQYRWCVTTSSKGCATTWNGTVNAPQVSVVTGTLTRGKTYYWQVQALVGGTWVSANGGTYWRFTTAR